MLEVVLAKFTENAISHLNLGIIELVSLVSYRFVSLSLIAILLVLTSLSVPLLRYIGVIYALIVDTYYCVLLDLPRNYSSAPAAKNVSKKKDWATASPSVCMY